MNAIPYDRPEEEWDRYDEGTQEDFALPGRPRRQWFNKTTAAVFAVLLGVIGFYVGVRVEKNQVSSSSSTAGAFTGAGTGGAAARLAAAGRTGAGGATGATGATGPVLPRAVAASVRCLAAVPVAWAPEARLSAASAASAVTPFTSRRPPATRSRSRCRARPR